MDVTNEQGLAAERLSCRRGGRLVFRGLSFRLEPGDALIVTGRNGSGKSSLLRVLAGLVPAYEGRLTWNGHSIADERDYFRRCTAYLGHLDAIKPTLSAFENLAVWGRLQTGFTTETQVLDALAAFALTPVAELPSRYLSAGQRRRLALARLFVSDAQLWLLDEPTIALDTASIADLERAIACHRAGGGLVVMATHSAIGIDRPSQLDLSAYAVIEADPDYLELQSYPANDEKDSF